MDYKKAYQLANYFKKLSYPGTMIVFEAIKEAKGTKNVKELSKEIGYIPESFNHYMKPLKELGLLNRQALKNGVIYTINEQNVRKFMNRLCEELLKDEN